MITRQRVAGKEIPESGWNGWEGLLARDPQNGDQIPITPMNTLQTFLRFAQEAFCRKSLQVNALRM